MPTLVFAGFGSNLGDRERHFQNTWRRLQAVPAFSKCESSPLYFSEPHVRAGEAVPAWYLNAVFAFETDAPAPDVLQILKTIESDLGRVSGKGTWEPRTVDLDLLFYGQMCLSQPGLQLPHPAIPTRRFVLQPLCDLRPDWRHPRLGKTLVELLQQCPDLLQIKPWQAGADDLG